MHKIRQRIGANQRQPQLRKLIFPCCCNDAAAGTADYRRYTFVSVPTYRPRSDTLVPDAFVHALDRRFECPCCSRYARKTDHGSKPGSLPTSPRAGSFLDTAFWSGAIAAPTTIQCTSTN